MSVDLELAVELVLADADDEASLLVIVVLSDSSGLIEDNYHEELSARYGNGMG